MPPRQARAGKRARSTLPHTGTTGIPRVCHRSPVNRDDLRLAAAREGISDTSYSIDGDRDETYCLGIAPGGWSVWFSERGNRNEEAFYETENEACSELLLASSKTPPHESGSPSPPAVGVPAESELGDTPWVSPLQWR